jgi:hypothetical protein
MGVELFCPPNRHVGGRAIPYITWRFGVVIEPVLSRAA